MIAFLYIQGMHTHPLLDQEFIFPIQAAHVQHISILLQAPTHRQAHLWNVIQQQQRAASIPHIHKVMTHPDWYTHYHTDVTRTSQLQSISASHQEVHVRTSSINDGMMMLTSQEEENKLQDDDDEIDHTYESRKEPIRTQPEHRHTIPVGGEFKYA